MLENFSTRSGALLFLRNNSHHSLRSQIFLRFPFIPRYTFLSPPHSRRAHSGRHEKMRDYRRNLHVYSAGCVRSSREAQAAPHNLLTLHPLILGLRVECAPRKPSLTPRRRENPVISPAVRDETAALKPITAGSTN